MYSKRKYTMAVDVAVLDEICVILPTGQKKFVSGLNQDTTCQEVVSALLADVESLPRSPPLFLWECWRNCSRRVAGCEKLHSLLRQWGGYIGEVRFEVRSLTPSELRSARWSRRIDRQRRRLACSRKCRRKYLQDVKTFASRGVWRLMQHRQVALLHSLVAKLVERCTKQREAEVRSRQSQADERNKTLQDLLLQRDQMLTDLKEFEVTGNDTGNLPQDMDIEPEESAFPSRQTSEEVDTLQRELSGLRQQLEQEQGLLSEAVAASETTHASLRSVESSIAEEEETLRHLQLQLSKELAAYHPDAAKSVSNVASSTEQSGPDRQSPPVHPPSVVMATPPMESTKMATPPQTRPPPPRRSSSREKFRELQAVYSLKSSPTTNRRNPESQPPEKGTDTPAADANPNADITSSLASMNLNDSDEPVAAGDLLTNERRASFPHMDSLMIGMSSKSTSLQQNKQNSISTDVTQLCHEEHSTELDLTSRSVAKDGQRRHHDEPVMSSVAPNTMCIDSSEADDSDLACKTSTATQNGHAECRTSTRSGTGLNEMDLAAAAGKSCEVKPVGTRTHNMFVPSDRITEDNMELDDEDVHGSLV